MPSIKQIVLLSTLVSVYCSSAVAQVEQSLLNDATRHYELSSFITAIPRFEKVLQDYGQQLSDSEKQTTLLRLAYAYKQVNNMAKAEATYRQALDMPLTLPAEQTKAYLYFAQVLIQNNKFKEAQNWYEKYQTFASSLSEDKAWQRYDLAQSVAVNKYKLEFLKLNTPKSEFSPMFYKDDLVFCSSKSPDAFLDLYIAKNSRTLEGITSSGQDPTVNETKDPNLFNKLAAENKAKQWLTVPFSKNLNSALNEGPCTFSQDFNTIIFTRNNAKETNSNEEYVKKLKLYQATFQNNEWTDIREMPFNDDAASTAHPSWSKDGHYLYFSSDRKDGRGGMDLWVVTYERGKWGIPVNLGETINTKGTETFPFVDEEGNLYFASDGLNGQGGLDIFYVKMQEGVPVGRPVNLGSPFNTPFDDFGIVTDGQRKQGYFSSDRRASNDDDIYRFTLDRIAYNCREMLLSVYDIETKQPVANAEVTVNMTDKEASAFTTNEIGIMKFCVGQDVSYEITVKRAGYFNYFMRYRTQGESDDAPTQIDIPLTKAQTETFSPVSAAEKVQVASKDAKGRKPLVIKGIIRSEIDQKPIEGVVVICTNECDNTTLQVKTSALGEYTFIVYEGCEYSLESSKDGYGSISRKVKKIIKKEKDILEEDLGLFKEGDQITIDDIYYESGSAKLKKDAAKELDKLASTLAQNPTMQVEIGAHTDSRGDATENLKLSAKRAEEVVKYLAKKGIDKSRMIAKGYGETTPINECVDGIDCQEREHQQNRRTTVKFIKAHIAGN